ncbi:heterodisulfide reductase-related iron-sulfur binding cluster [Ferrimonas sp. YFM]|uniref:heterodisulfide reductase-related iron-sulfur binding cluster n=1 Tax=Ferrimonas sp. YFM TaxID=3028878 RepID=UPI002572E7EE|nr:heterodisulfide reductase-related iron-sulfur binding cluster [Ferrimonas sp. YFM]BDY06007.1 ferredoxin [Ferrimonas sp. YFM]
MAHREGSLEAPTRHPLEWRKPEFYDRDALNQELERVFDVCHGCRRCVSLCHSFPTLFDLVDESDTMEVDGVDKADYAQVVDHCYLCDLCYLTKCPYVPPHEWNIDFPHLMLRAKAVKFHESGARFRDKLLTSTTTVGRLASLPGVNSVVNALNDTASFRNQLESTLGVHHQAPLPKYHSKTIRHRTRPLQEVLEPVPAGETTGKVALFSTCYGNFNAPHLGEDLYKVFQHNGIHIELVPGNLCCGMPKLELGDLESVQTLMEKSLPVLTEMVDEGFDIIAPVPSCVLMFKQELPLMFPEDHALARVQRAFFDPFEYLALRHKAGLLNTDFPAPLGKVSYQVACHQRVQRIGMKTKEILSLIPGSDVTAIERCSGHDGTYAVKEETHANAVKIARPVVRKLDQLQGDHLVSDCPMAATHLANLAEGEALPTHPITLLRQAYGL